MNTNKISHFCIQKEKWILLRWAASEMLSVKKPAMSSVCFHQAITHTTMLSLKVSPNMPLQGDDIQGWHTSPRLHEVKERHTQEPQIRGTRHTPTVGARIAPYVCGLTASQWTVSKRDSCAEMFANDRTAEQGALESQKWVLLTARETVIGAFDIRH